MNINDEKRFRRSSRREFLKLAPLVALGAFAVPRFRDPLLMEGLELTDWFSARLFRPGHLARTFSNSQVTPIEKFPLNSYEDDDPEVDLENWTLSVSGEVRSPGEYTLAQIQKLPRFMQNTRHICVEGWDVIGNFGGARLSGLLNAIGADTKAKFIYFECADGYYESLDMATALHPQSLLCYEMYGKPLERERGAPVRLALPTKIGYKSAKYLTSLRVTNVLQKKGYWEDQGYDWHYGL